MHVDASAKMHRDGGSIPPASTNDKNRRLSKIRGIVAVSGFLIGLLYQWRFYNITLFG